MPNNPAKPDRRHHGLILLLIMAAFLFGGVVIVSTVFQGSHTVAGSINKAGSDIQEILKDVKKEVKEVVKP